MIFRTSNQRPNRAFGGHALKKSHEHSEKLVIGELAEANKQRKTLTNQLEADARRPFLERMNHWRCGRDHAVAQKCEIQMPFLHRQRLIVENNGRKSAPNERHGAVLERSTAETFL